MPGRSGCSSDRSSRSCSSETRLHLVRVTAIGLGIVFVGVIIVSNVWKTPTYNVILAWGPRGQAGGWEAGRRTNFTINWIQLAVTWTAFALFPVALGSL